MTVTSADLQRFVQEFAGVIAENKRMLVQLDAAIGDGDHGENLNRGMKAAAERVGALEEPTPAEVLKAVATALISKVGGAAGPLFGTAFLRASTAAGDRGELDGEVMVQVLAAGLEGVQQRGKAEPGDKTMIDAWTPAVAAAREAQEAGEPVAAILRAAAQGAEQGMNDTVELVARKGRASYLGERSKGHQDPGATSSWLLLDTLARVAES